MDILGIGPMELFFVILIALIIMGPKDMQKAGRTIGKWLNSVVRSDSWKIVKQASNKIKYLPNELMREAGIEELNKISNEIKSDVKKGMSTDFEDPFEAWKQKHPDLKTINPTGSTQKQEETLEDKEIDNSEGEDQKGMEIQ
ncbi:twin-arginine translocase TatA/TatE family subunit [Chloroflexota bacterium]